MAVKTGAESVGLKGAKTIGDKKVSSLLHFSWSTRHANVRASASAHGAIKSERDGAHGESAVSEQRRREKD
jgi:hypothetical protein